MHPASAPHSQQQGVVTASAEAASGGQSGPAQTESVTSSGPFPQVAKSIKAFFGSTPKEAVIKPVDWVAPEPKAAVRAAPARVLSVFDAYTGS